MIVMVLEQYNFRVILNGSKLAFDTPIKGINLLAGLSPAHNEFSP